VGDKNFVYLFTRAYNGVEVTNRSIAVIKSSSTYQRAQTSNHNELRSPLQTTPTAARSTWATLQRQTEHSHLCARADTCGQINSLARCPDSHSASAAANALSLISDKTRKSGDTLLRGSPGRTLQARSRVRSARQIKETLRTCQALATPVMPTHSRTQTTQR
jgi:hypothetical protein